MLSANHAAGEMLLQDLRHANCFRDNAWLPLQARCKREQWGRKGKNPCQLVKSEADSAASNYLHRRTPKRSPKRVREKPKPSNTKGLVPDRENLLLAKGCEESRYVIPGEKRARACQLTVRSLLRSSHSKPLFVLWLYSTVDCKVPAHACSSRMLPAPENPDGA